MICSVIANTVRDRKKKSKPWTPDDFMPIKEQKQMTAEQMFAQVQTNNLMLGGEVLEI